MTKLQNKGFTTTEELDRCKFTLHNDLRAIQKRGKQLLIEDYLSQTRHNPGEKYLIRCNVCVCAFCWYRDGDNTRIKIASRRSKWDLLLALARTANRDAGT